MIKNSKILKGVLNQSISLFSPKISSFKAPMSFGFSQKKEPQGDNKNPFSTSNPEDSYQPQIIPKIEHQSSPIGTYALGLSVFALILGYIYMEVQVFRAEKTKPKVQKSTVTGVGKAHIGGSWQLLDTKGGKMSSKDLEGTYYLIYFGFTNCPDICPNSLTKLARAVKRVKHSKQSSFFNLKTIFISVDPDRDTPQKIDTFIKFFDPQMIGLTGKSNEDPVLKDCMKKFKIYSSKLEFEDENTLEKGRKNYTIDHTILTYLMNGDNEYLTHLGANLGEHDMSHMIIDKIMEDQKEKVKAYKL